MRSWVQKTSHLHPPLTKQQVGITTLDVFTIKFCVVGLTDCPVFSKTNKCYTLSKATATWSNARKACQETKGLNGDLATIADQETMDFIKQNLEVTGRTWIGGEKLSGEWSWADGTTWSYTNWQSSQPDSDDALYIYTDYLWWDLSKTEENYYICQYSF